MISKSELFDKIAAYLGTIDTIYEIKASTAIGDIINIIAEMEEK